MSDIERGERVLPASKIPDLATVLDFPSRRLGGWLLQVRLDRVLDGLKPPRPTDCLGITFLKLDEIEQAALIRTIAGSGSRRTPMTKGRWDPGSERLARALR